jgi:hypothetical protein
MTLIEVVEILLFLGFSAGGMVVGSAHHGTLGGLVGFLLGLGVLPALVGVLFALDRVWCWFVPPRPRCARGVCGARDYAYLNRFDEGLLLACRCGDTYASRRAPGERALRFVRVTDGQTHPYMVRRARRWVPDERGAGSPYR